MALLSAETPPYSSYAPTKTRWMHGRHQIIRHIDAAWEIRGTRAVFGFFVVEGDNGGADSTIPPNWIQYAKETVSADAIDSSLPHRSPSERDGIAAAFLGVTTWQAVCDEFDLDRCVMIEKLETAPFRPRAVEDEG